MRKNKKNKCRKYYIKQLQEENSFSFNINEQVIIKKNTYKANAKLFIKQLIISL